MKENKIDWKNYNKELINRGSITFWFDLENKADWYLTNHECRKGRRYIYSWLAIEMLCLLRSRFGLTLRGLQGFAQSLFNLMGVDIKMPNYTTVGRRLDKMDVVLERKYNKGQDLHVAIDSSGLKIYGEGEWKVRIHGRQKHRTWRKIHLAVDSKDNTILSAVMSTNDIKDSEVFNDLVSDIEGVKSIYADGAYESNRCYNKVEEIGANPIIPPRKNAKISKKGSQTPRDQTIREIKVMGRKTWKEVSGYHNRSIAETSFSRMKIIMGDKLRSRNFNSQANEAFLKCKALNKMNTPRKLSS